MSTRVSWVRCADGLAHLPMLEGPGMLVTHCQRSLPDTVPQSGVVPEGQRRCPECFAALTYPRDAVPQAPTGRRSNRSSSLSSGPWRPAGPSSPARREEVTVPEPDSGGCPCCGATSAVRRLVCDSPKVEAWSCAVCEARWWSSRVNHPQLYPSQLVEEVAAWSMLREVETLAAQAPGLSDGQLQARALSLLAAVDQYARTWPE